MFKIIFSILNNDMAVGIYRGVVCGKILSGKLLIFLKIELIRKTSNIIDLQLFKSITVKSILFSNIHHRL